jgi:hypothetical protein
MVTSGFPTDGEDPLQSPGFANVSLGLLNKVESELQVSSGLGEPRR